MGDLSRRSLAKAGSAFSLRSSVGHLQKIARPHFSKKIFETFSIGSGENK
jgi:hypothetical protein